MGKSAVALALAEQLEGEIVSVDSMQVYRGMDIGTAKPAAEEQRRVPHHLIDILDLSASFDAAQFVVRARQAVAGIQARSRQPILCGGTGLYFRAFLEGLEVRPPSDPALRKRLEIMPLAELLRQLRQLDPAACERIDPLNPRRVLRALEVRLLTGKPLSELEADGPDRPAPRSFPAPAAFFYLTRSREDLYARINSRVEQMFQLGLVAETAGLLERGLAHNLTALQALGYRQVVEHLRGQRNLLETVALVKSRTRQFARRQATWFRHQLTPQWIALEAGESPAQTAARVSKLLAPEKQIS